MNRSETMKKAEPILSAVKLLAKKHGEELTKYACRRWLEGVAERKKLLKEKTRAESRLAQIKKELGE